jgi:hypothetical protein
MGFVCASAPWFRRSPALSHRSVHEEEKVVVITYDIAETYVPIRITTFALVTGENRGRRLRHLKSTEVNDA